MTSKFARVKKGPKAGEFVPALDVNPSINLMSEPMAPRSGQTRSGYGSKMPTRHKVRVFDQRWRRVYMVQKGNAGTAFIIHKGERFAVTW
jgi:hypothetical protein